MLWLAYASCEMSCRQAMGGEVGFYAWYLSDTVASPDWPSDLIDAAAE
jgi:hypothetical protein